jgi:glutamate-1-semialdehyde 2,1-aminomutase
VILGHADARVTRAVHEAAARGLSYGAPTAAEVALAERLCERVPGLEQVRLVCSGTEATMSALRLARAATGRGRILKFDGCYHGHGDSLLVAAGSGALTFGVPSSPGVPDALAALTVSVPYNDLSAVRAALEAARGEFAAVIVEPVAGNMGCVLPQPGFLQGLRALCDAHGALLIVDEVMTGFRVGPAGALGRYGVRADLVTLGKVIGGGMPLAAYGGRADLMREMAPAGPVYQAGTLAGNPLATAAGLAVLDALSEPGFHEALDAAAARLTDGLAQAAAAAGVPLAITRAGGMFGLFFAPAAAHDLAGVQATDTGAYAAVFRALLERGVFLAPSPYEASFVSAAHGGTDLDATSEAAHAALREVAGAAG